MGTTENSNTRTGRTEKLTNLNGKFIVEGEKLIDLELLDVNPQLRLLLACGGCCLYAAAEAAGMGEQPWLRAWWVSAAVTAPTATSEGWPQPLLQVLFKAGREAFAHSCVLGF